MAVPQRPYGQGLTGDDNVLQLFEVLVVLHAKKGLSSNYRIGLEYHGNAVPVGIDYLKRKAAFRCIVRLRWGWNCGWQCSRP